MQRLTLRLACIATVILMGATPARATDSVARQWNDLALEAIRNDFARPTVHARNLFHSSVAMWDAWAAYDDEAHTYLHHENATAVDIQAAREESISFAAYRLLAQRFSTSPGAGSTVASFNAKMDELGYDRTNTDTTGSTPAALGNRIAETILAHGDEDGANEAGDYANLFYEPVNSELFPALPGNPSLTDPNRWQPLSLDFFIDQAGNPLPIGSPPFLSPEWGIVTPFALQTDDLTIYQRQAQDWWVYHDPGPPPQFGGAEDTEYKEGFEQVLEWSGLLDPTDGVMLDIGPGARGNNTLGTNDGSGHALNPHTGLPYDPNVVLAGDYYRVLAEFWADGPDSETPPGHWFVIANAVTDDPNLVKKFGGTGPIIDDLEWDVALYLTIGGTMHDAAITAWGIKGWYDYLRPVSAIRYLADLGQRSDPGQAAYHPDGIALEPGRVEVVTAASIAPGERHEHLGVEAIDKIAAKAWRGPDYIPDPETTTAGVGWILVENWWPYQRPTFVTPPFAGYVSGHSTYSRAAAEVMTRFTGDAFFPGGVGTFVAPQNDFLVFEEGPSDTVNLTWATYADAADECSLSRIYGGIHPRADDIPGRIAGYQIGIDAFDRAGLYFQPPYEQVSGALDMKVATIKTKADKGKIVVKGTLITGVAGAHDVLDSTTGIRLDVTDGLGLDESYEWTPDECVFKWWNGTVSCKSPDKSSKISFKPKKNTPEYKFSATLKNRTLPATVGGPVSINIGDSRFERDVTMTLCIDKITKVICRQ